MGVGRVDCFVGVADVGGVSGIGGSPGGTGSGAGGVT